ncbi:MAG: hypothetical protein PVJ27_09405 [Candidatus Brocadiaceae bacterium]|jgi:hypothetical protein
MRKLVTTVMVYGVALVLVWLLMPLTWGAVTDFCTRSAIAGDQELQQELGDILERAGVDAGGASPSRVLGRADELPPAVRQDVEAALYRASRPEVNWFAVTFAVSAVVFGLAGLVCGFFTRGALLAGVVPLASFLYANPVVAFEPAASLPAGQKGIVIAVAQFTVCYVCAYVGARLGRKVDRKRWERDRPSRT